MSSVIACLLVFLIPFSYFDLFGYRVVVGSVFLFFSLFLVSVENKIYFDKAGLLFLPPLFFVMSMSFFSGSKDVLSALLFTIYLCFLNFFSRSQLFFLLPRLCSLYLYGAVFIALGVICQRLLFELFGFAIGKIDAYGGGRIGFGFLWMDYSFLSLYLVSALPLVFYSYKSIYVRVFVSAVLLLGSVVTTARTGLGALVLATIFVSVVEFIRVLVRGKVNKRVMLTLLFLAIASFVTFYFYVEFSSRSLKLDGSGRFEGYYLAFNAFLDSPILGVMFDRDYYVSNYGVLPHNLFLYILSQGGGLLFVLFFVWFSYVFYLACFRVQVFRYPIIIATFGFMFIPSFFSAYFLALLISFVVAEKRVACPFVEVK